MINESYKICTVPGVCVWVTGAACQSSWICFDVEGKCGLLQLLIMILNVFFFFIASELRMALVYSDVSDGSG